VGGVAVRVTGSSNPQENGLFYTLGDHLGSTSLVTDASGNKVGEMRYMPWGETRYDGGTTPTDYRYTGQREEAGIGLYYYNARWYDAKLGRFAQADTYIPNRYTPISYDRFGYVNNNSINFVDPSGNRPSCEFEQSNCTYMMFPNQKKTPREYAVNWMLNNAKGNDCTNLGGDCACTVGDAFNHAWGGDLKIDPKSMAYIRTDDLKKYLLSTDSHGNKRGKELFYWKNKDDKGETQPGNLTNSPGWEAAQDAMKSAGVKAGDLIFYNDVHGNDWGGTTHVAMVWKIDDDGNIWVMDNERKPHLLSSILDEDAQIGEIWVIRPNYYN
jgi:RHS repeat-associated protein